MNLIDNLTLTFKKGNALTKLIFVNVGMFLLVNIFLIALKMFKIDGIQIIDYLELPSNPTILLHQLWTPITYMFLHLGFMHLLFNMLMLYWFGKIFLMYYSEKQLVALYFYGGLISALVYVLAFNFFPIYENVRYNSFLLGASGSIMAIILATGIKTPNAEMNLFLIGRIKLIYIAIAAVLISIFGITGKNSGGEMAHLGGALAGYLFVTLEKKGKDITPFFNKIIDFFVNLFRRRESKFKTKTYHSANMSDGDYNQRKSNTEAEINRILDKIKTSGYESLTSAEKKKLFEQKR